MATSPKLLELHFTDPEGTRLRPFVIGTEPDYFTLFELPARLLVDTEALRALFLDLSRRCHPDFHATADAPLREESLRRTALLNNAYKTLQDDQRRAEYLIERSGVSIVSGKNAVPPELLSEMFDIQEAGEDLREARLDGDGEKLAEAEKRVVPLRNQAKASRDGLLGELQTLFAEHDRLTDQGMGTVEILHKVRLTLDRMNYLRTVLRNLK